MTTDELDLAPRPRLRGVGALVVAVSIVVAVLSACDDSMPVGNGGADASSFDAGPRDAGWDAYRPPIDGRDGGDPDADGGLDASCAPPREDRSCTGDVVLRGVPTPVADARWTLSADLAQRLDDGSWIWIAGIRDEDNPARFIGYQVVRASEHFETVTAEGMLQDLPRSEGAVEWGVQGIGPFALDACRSRMLIPIHGTGGTRLASFTTAGAAGPEAMEDLPSGARVAYDGVGYRVLSPRPPVAGSCTSAFVPMTVDASSVGIARGADLVRDDWPRSPTTWRDGRWRLGGTRCGSDELVFFTIDSSHTVAGPVVAAGLGETATEWAVQFPLGSSAAVLLRVEATATGHDVWAAVYDPDTGLPRGPAFVLERVEGRARTTLFVQAEDDSTFGWAYADEPSDGSPGQRRSRSIVSQSASS